MKILMVGLGSIGQRHFRNILYLLGEKAQISAYRVRQEQTVITDNLTVEEGIRLDKKYKYTLYDDLDKALDSFPEVVFICNPSSLHMPVALKAAKRECHLFIEKPLSHNLEDIEELACIVREKNLVLFVAFNFRFHPCYIQLKKMLQEEKIGNLIAVHIEMGEYLPGWHKWEDYRRMYASCKNLGGGAILTQIHHIDYAMDLFGMPKSVYTIGGHSSSLELDVEDNADTLMECPYKGRLLPVHIHVDYIQKTVSNNCRIIGEKGVLAMDFSAGTIIMTDEKGKEEKYDYGSYQRKRLYIDELKHFFACMHGEEKPLVDIKTAYDGMKIAMAIKESMEKGKKIMLDQKFEKAGKRT